MREWELRVSQRELHRMHVVRLTIEGRAQKLCPSPRPVLALYIDRHGIFRRNDDHWSLEEQLALRGLGNPAIFALSPQAKLRVERSEPVNGMRHARFIKLDYKILTRQIFGPTIHSAPDIWQTQVSMVDRRHEHQNSSYFGDG